MPRNQATETREVKAIREGKRPYDVLEVSADKRATEWWRSDGIYIDPDTDEVDWFHKRAEIAQMAYIAGFKAGAEHAPKPSKPRPEAGTKRGAKL
jgi:hypothetical protein